MTATAESNLSVLVVCEDARRYAELLSPLSEQGVRIAAAESVASAIEQYQGQPILLAQPDMAADIIDQLPDVQWVQSTWAGITPLLQTRRQDYLLTGVKHVFGPQMAEYTFGYLLAHEQKLLQRHQQQQSGSWWDLSSGRLQGKTLGIMGTGSIGSYIAGMAANLGLNVLGFSLSGAARDGFAQVYAHEQLLDFLCKCDYVVAVLPDTPETTRLMNADSFVAMKNTAVFINIGRGNLVDEAALASALGSGQLAAAVLDVFQTEPLPPDNPLWTTANVVITGHVAARSWPEDIASIFLENFSHYQQRLDLLYVIDRQRGY